MEKQIKYLINRFLYLYVPISLIIIVSTYKNNLNLSHLHILLLFGVLIISFQQRKSLDDLIKSHVSELTAKTDSAAKTSFKTFPVSTIIIEKETCLIKWHNDEFVRNFEFEGILLERNICDFLDVFTVDKLKNHFSHFPTELEINSKIYRVFSCVNVECKDELNIYFIEVTEDVKIREAYEKTKSVISVISIDNYDELLRNATDTEKSIIVAAINTRISKWTEQIGGIFRKIDRDKYLFIFENSHMQSITQTKFPVLDSIREIQTAEGIAATLSIGIGKDGESIADNYEYSLNALDMALSRGGDQAVIKNKYSFEFYGGASKEVEKRTKVKSRVIANALNQIIKDASEVYIMGHTFSDFDSVGSAIGMCAAVRSNEKPYKIVIDMEKSSAKPLLQKLQKNDAYKDVFITPDDALVKLNPDTLLIVVDTNRPSFVESQSILEACPKVVVIDHHRRAADYIENATVNMHEPYASSTCEIVTELLQYMLNSNKVTKTEAEALLSGIILDTKHFTAKTGSRTFEAAAYLKRIGADVEDVKSLFQNDFDTYILRQQLTSFANIYNDKYVISVSSADVERSVASQCADELLNILNIQASFVIFKTGNNTNISARSDSRVNVQTIMEQLGGGGSINAAACQFDSDTTENVERMLKQVLDDLDKQDEI